MSDASVSSRTIFSTPNQACPVLKKTLEIVEESVDDRELERYEYLVGLLSESDDVQLGEALSPEGLKDILADLLQEIDQFRESGDEEPRIHARNSPRNFRDDLPYSLVSIVVPDQPFLVDSVTEWMAGEPIDVSHLFYGSLSEDVFPSSNDSTPFLLTLFVEQQTPEELDAIEDALEEVLADIRAAVTDFDAMTETVRELSERIAGTQPDGTAADVPEDRPDLASNFLDYLLDENFVFLGSFRIEDGTEAQYEDRLGICRSERNLDLTAVDPTQPDDTDGPHLLNFYKTNVESRVYRRERLDSVTVDPPGSDGSHVLLGLFTNNVLAQPAVQVPLLHEKFEAIVNREGISEHTHNYRDFYAIFNSMPKHILLMSSVDDILEDLNSILSVRGERTFKLRARPIPFRRGLSLMILMERDRFSGDVRRDMQELLREEFEASSIDYHLSLGAGALARLHFDVETERMNPAHCSYDELEQKLFDLTRTWYDHFEVALRERFDEDRSRELLNRYEPIFEENYRALVEPDVAPIDAENLRSLEENEADQPVLDLSNPPGQDTTRFVIYDRKKHSLNDTLPVLSNHGFSVEQQSTFTLTPDGESFHLHLFEITDDENEELDLSGNRERLLRSIKGVLRGNYRNDILNQLIYLENFRPRTLNLLRLYKNYFHQLEPAIKLETINRTLVEFHEWVAEFVECFRLKFDPSIEDDREKKLDEQHDELTRSLEDVDRRSCYQILRWNLDFLSATVRTNFYQQNYPDTEIPEGPTVPLGEDKSYISVKIRSEELSELESVPSKHEIFVYSPFVEAIHLRSGDIARGGIRWSDRRDDYRTEVMELMETQKKKNALIVPVGAKGGFVLKEEHLDDDKPPHEHAREQYTVFMRGMLDLTDNIVDGEVRTPPEVVRYDGDDPYLVVAADKGTARFSDLANSIAEAYDFWLTDAFASGGSVGYDHKELGITAKGGWECVKRHFREMGRDPSSEPFTVSGIGDMGGDVFGNGMILSDRIKLVAAFNHRHIFLDPDPDPEQSFQERQRLFGADESGWDHYDEPLISEGGGIYDRNASVISLEDPALELLDLDDEPHPPEKVIRAILKANVDLLWNGGIGTYIKSSDESHGAVEDPQNDPFRVDADRVRAKVIGEGGNLGITQKGRVDLARQGVRLNTDFIDNSGGVDLSDHEVNLKILLQKSIEAEEVHPDERTDLLDTFRDPSVKSVLENSYRQSATISLEVRNSSDRLDDYRSLMNHLDGEVRLDRSREVLPDEQELQDRQRAGEGMTRPEVSILLSYAKQDLYQKALEEHWPPRTITTPFLERYFPDRVPDQLSTGLEKHTLRNEIALTALVNYAIDGVGFTFFHRLKDQLGTSLISLLKGFRTADLFAEGESLRSDIFSQDGNLEPDVQYRAWTILNDRLAHAVTWLVDSVNESLVYQGFLDSMKKNLEEHFDTIFESLQPRQEEYFQQNVRDWAERGFGEDFGRKLAKVSYLVPALEVIMIARDHPDQDVRALSETYFELGRHLHVDWIIRRVFERSTKNRWDDLAFRTLGVEVHNIQRDILQRMLRNGQSLEGFLEEHRPTLDRLDEIQRNLMQEETEQFSAYQYMVQRMRSLI